MAGRSSERDALVLLKVKIFNLKQIKNVQKDGADDDDDDVLEEPTLNLNKSIFG